MRSPFADMWCVGRNTPTARQPKQTLWHTVRSHERLDFVLNDERYEQNARLFESLLFGPARSPLSFVDGFLVLRPGPCCCQYVSDLV